MKKILFIIFLITSFPQLSFAEVVKRLNIEGNKRISEETIKVYGDIKLNQDYDELKLNKILRNLYETEFFEDIDLQLRNNTLNIKVKEFQIINNIIFEGEKANKIQKAILERLQLQVKNSFIKSKLNQDIETIKSIYNSMGFNFVKVNTKLETFSEERVDIIFTVEKGIKTKISKINFVGDKKIKERRLRDIIVSEESKFWKIITKNTNLNNENIELDKRLLKNYYKSLGYYDVQVLSSKAVVKEDNTSEITFNINAGERYRIKKIKTNISDVLDKKDFIGLKDSYSKIIGKYYSPFLVKDLLDDLEELIIDNDLQFIEHSVNEVLQKDEVEIVINIFEGEKLLVEKINFKGNTITDESVLRSELLLDEGDPFNNLKLQQSIAKIKSRNIFGLVESKVSSGSSEDLKIIEINVEEKPTGEISAGAGVGTDGGTFAFNINENNYLGKGLKVQSFLEVSRDSLKGSLEVKNPNYNYSGNELNFFLSSTQNDKPDQGFENSLISAGVGTKFEQYKNIYLSPAVEFSYDDLQVNSSASSALQKQEGSFSEIALSYGITLDERNRAYDPTDGFISAFTQKLPVVADSPYIVNKYSISTYKQLNQNIIGSLKFYGAAINGLGDDDVRISKRLFAPTSRLRGFESGKVGPKDGTDYIGGNYVTTLNLEANLPNLLPESTRTDVMAFLDFGNIWNVDYDSSLDDSNKIRSSIGLSTNWSSPVGPMSFIFSQNISKASTDKTQGFNFRLGTTF